MDTLIRDIRHAVRTLGKQRAFTLTALTMLALGIGANTAMFGIVNTMLLRPLPYPDAEAIVSIGETGGPATASRARLTNRSVFQIEEDAESFEQVAGYLVTPVDWASPDGVIGLERARISPSLFPLLRARPHLGRLFTRDEARVGAARVVLLSYGAWTRRFASDPDIVGTLVDLDYDPHTVVGVLSEGFYFPSPDEELWTPFVIPPFVSESGNTIGIAFNALGRLRPGVSPAQAATEVRTILRRGNDAGQRTREGTRSSGDAPQVDAQVIPLQQQLAAEYRPALLALSRSSVSGCISTLAAAASRGR